MADIVYTYTVRSLTMNTRHDIHYEINITCRIKVLYEASTNVFKPTISLSTQQPTTLPPPRPHVHHRRSVLAILPSAPFPSYAVTNTTLVDMRSILAFITIALSMALRISAAPIAWDNESTASQIERDLARLKRSTAPAVADLSGIKHSRADLAGLKRSSSDLAGLKDRSSTDLAGLRRWIVELVQRASTQPSNLKRSGANLSGFKRSMTDLAGLKRAAKDLAGLKRSMTDLAGLKRAAKDLAGLKRSATDLAGLKRAATDLAGLKRSATDLAGLKRNAAGLSGLKRTTTELFGIRSSSINPSGLIKQRQTFRA
jgi:hypothetical protein